MKYLSRLVILFLGVVSLFLCGCDDDEAISRPPTYQGFKYSPSVVHGGETVKITAVQLTKGTYLNATNYNWSMTVKLLVDGVEVDETLTYSDHTNYDGVSNANPVWELEVPENIVAGTYTCTFKARFNNSAGGESFYSSGTTGAGCTGTIRSSYDGLMYSSASGSFNLPILAKQ